MSSRPRITGQGISGVIVDESPDYTNGVHRWVQGVGVVTLKPKEHKVVRIPRLCGNCIFWKNRCKSVRFCSKIQQYVHEQMLACKRFHEYRPSITQAIQIDIDKAIAIKIKKDCGPHPVESLLKEDLRDAINEAVNHSFMPEYEIRLNTKKPKPKPKRKKKKFQDRFSKLAI